MALHFPQTGIARQILQSGRKHAVLLWILFGLSIAAAASNTVFRGQLISPNDPESGQEQTKFALGRMCSSEGTPFESIVNLEQAILVFRREASAITLEHEDVLRKPSTWVCPKSEAEPQDPPMNALQTLANKLPGWQFRYKETADATLGWAITKPVSFKHYSSVLGELLRAYECKLAEMQDTALPLLYKNSDLAGPFCCSGNSCVEWKPGVTCKSGITPDPECGMKTAAEKEGCIVAIDFVDLPTRLDPFHRRLSEERQRARFAVERTIEAFRSYDLRYPMLRDLFCYARASLDLREEMSLLADAVSCMPRIWDQVTSFHDRAQ